MKDQELLERIGLLFATQALSQSSFMPLEA
jgi:hypothetical protein